ncbi:nucleoside deaminase [Deinococcus petrolearius]|uniref:Nucleoside deaminase n=1 Tax=Deinococcus petrolearius TaxID=1751295 RepID=A0ABW1DJH3_9DEIO
MSGAGPGLGEEGLPAPWQAALEEAWEAYLRGSYPIGACVADASGRVLARGRNRLGEERRVDGVISGHRLGHAEVNALLELPDLDAQTGRALTLYTTTEPCPMCLGALLMARVGGLAYAAADPWAGHSEALTLTAYPSRKGVRLGRAPAAVIRACLLLELTFHLDRGMAPDHGYLTVHRAQEPWVYAAAEALHRSGALAALRDRQAPLAGGLALLDGSWPVARA